MIRKSAKERDPLSIPLIEEKDDKDETIDKPILNNVIKEKSDGGDLIILENQLEKNVRDVKNSLKNPRKTLKVPSFQHAGPVNKILSKDIEESNEDSDLNIRRESLNREFNNFIDRILDPEKNPLEFFSEGWKQLTHRFHNIEEKGRQLLIIRYLTLIPELLNNFPEQRKNIIDKFWDIEIVRCFKRKESDWQIVRKIYHLLLTFISSFPEDESENIMLQQIIKRKRII